MFITLKKLEKIILLTLQTDDLLDTILPFDSGSFDESLKDGQTTGLASLQEVQIKNEPLILTESELHALAKDRQKKDNHNMSECSTYLLTKVFSLSIFLTRCYSFQLNDAEDLI